MLLGKQHQSDSEQDRTHDQEQKERGKDLEVKDLSTELTQVFHRVYHAQKDCWEQDSTRWSKALQRRPRKGKLFRMSLLSLFCLSSVLGHKSNYRK